MSGPFDVVVDALEARDLGVRRSESSATSRCPAHDDRNASLSVGIGDDERALLKCREGCPTEAIAAALGLELRDLFPASSNSSGNGHLEFVESYPYVDATDDPGDTA